MLATLYLLPILLYDLRFLKYELAFLVLLRFLIGFLVLPAQHLTAITAVDISDRVKPRHELPVLLCPRNDIHGVREEKCTTILPLKGLGDDVVVEADVVPAMVAAVNPRPDQFRHHQFRHPLSFNRSPRLIREAEGRRGRRGRHARRRINRTRKKGLEGPPRRGEGKRRRTNETKLGTKETSG